MILLLSLGAAALAFWVVAPLVGLAPAVIAPGDAVCPNCGLRPESDARYCSNCGAATGRLSGS